MLLGEFIIGRKTQKDAVQSYKTLAPGTKWHWIGYLGMATCFILLSFYSVVGGWILVYIIKGFTGGLSQTSGFDTIFASTISNPYLAVGGQSLFMVVTILVVAKGKQRN